MGNVKEKKVIHIDDLLAQFGEACDECGSMHNNRACEICCKRLVLCHQHLARCALCRTEAGQADMLSGYFLAQVLGNDLQFLQGVQKIAQETGVFSPAALAGLFLDSVRREEEG